MPEDKPRKFAKDFLEKWARAEREEGPADVLLRKVDEALKAAPDDADLWHRRGSLLLELDRWEEALAAFRRVETLDPAHERLYDALAFTLGKLGRTDEAAEAQKKALAAASRPVAEAPTPEVAEELKPLAEALQEEVLEEEAVDRLRELEALGEEAAPEREFPAKLAAWEAEGFDVSPLREVLEKEPDRARTAFFQFEQNVQKVQVLRDTLDALDPKGLEEPIARVRASFRSPYQIWKIEAEMAVLLEAADDRDRAARIRPAPPSAAPSPPRARPAGATNGGPAGRGRVNGLTAGVGRVNGMAGPGRVNGVTGAGRVNGLVNGLRSARSGLTNGLTNGMGLTNGLGGTRFAVEVRSRRWRLFLIPLIAFVLLAVPLFVSEPQRTLGGVAINGNFDDWSGVYGQTGTASNANVDLSGYAVHFEDGRLSIYAKVRGLIFADTNPDVLWVFVDTDGSRATGYNEGRIGADLLLMVQGENRTIERTDVRIWAANATDRGDWNGWKPANLAFSAAIGGSAGNQLEGQVDVTAFPVNTGGAAFEAARALVSFDFEDQVTSHSESALVVGTAAVGALAVTQAPAAREVNATSSQQFLRLTFDAFGATVTVTSVAFTSGAGTPDPTGFTALTVQPGFPQTVTMTVDATGQPAGSFLTSTLTSVVADHPVTISGDGARAYVGLGSTPATPVVDGLFGEWTSYLNDTDPAPVRDANVNITQYESRSPSGIAFAYVKVVGNALSGAPAPVAVVKETHGAQAPPNGTAPIVPRHGEDVLAVYYDANGSTGGTPVYGIDANAYVEVRGRFGIVLSAKAFKWSGGWLENGTARAVAVGSRIELSLDVPGLDFRGAPYIIAARDWRGVADATAIGGVRGTRSSGGGVTYYDSYASTLPAAADGLFRFSTPSGLGFSWRLPGLVVDRAGIRIPVATAQPVLLSVENLTGRYANAYDNASVEVRYAAQPGVFKEVITVRTVPTLQPGDDLVFDFPLTLDAGLLIDATGERVDGGMLVNGTLSFIDGHGLSINLPAPWVEDATGRRADLRFFQEAGRLRVALPSPWLEGATYPIVLDPTVTYILKDNGPTYKVSEQMGYSVAIGDFNGDGYADVLAGAPTWGYTGHTNIGYAYIYNGPFTANRTAPDVRINGTAGGGSPSADSLRFGFAVAAGKFHANSGCSNCWDALVSKVSSTILSISGPACMFYGTSAWTGGVDVTSCNVKIEPPSTNYNNYGWYVAAGNIDNAYYDDVLVGAPGRNNTGGACPTGCDGAVFLYKSPFSADVTSANYTLLPSTDSNGQLGRSIAVGKIDSDAYPDIVAGEPAYNSNAGRVQFYKGSNFLSGSGNRNPDVTIGAPSGAQYFGGALAVGDVNPDAYSDVIVGAPGSSSCSGNGGAYLFLANGDGSGLTTGASPNKTFPNQVANEGFGCSVAVGNWNGDGTPDVFVGATVAPGSGGTPSAAGRVYWYDDPLTSQTPTSIIYGVAQNEHLGQSLALGRFGSDSRLQLAIGAPNWPKTGTQTDGRVVVATVPEPALLMISGVLILAVASRSLQRRRLIRKR